MSRQIILWPGGARVKRFSQKTGGVVIHETKEKVSIWECPTCHAHLSFPGIDTVRSFTDTYCVNCGRDLRKPITFFEKVHQWFVWLGDYQLMRRYPIISVKEKK